MVSALQRSPDTRGALGLCDLPLRNLEKLVARNIRGACRLAGYARVTLRPSDPRAERRFSALLRRLTKHLS